MQLCDFPTLLIGSTVGTSSDDSFVRIPRPTVLEPLREQVARKLVPVVPDSELATTVQAEKLVQVDRKIVGRFVSRHSNHKGLMATALRPTSQ
jgi:hypothetical protein